MDAITKMDDAASESKKAEPVLGAKEVAYDRDISPLVTKVHEFCAANGIKYIATFYLDGDLRCSTVSGGFDGLERTAMKMLGLPV